ncbi:ATP-binding protein, partial [Clostridium perfringens]
MNKESQEFNFKFPPSVITNALGSKIIELDSIVISELIKNSKDANAQNITVDFSDYKNQIVIIDDGEGMNINDIKTKWGIVASDNKSMNPELLGGKGIGRFSLFKICDKFTIITKKASYDEFTFSIDIKDFSSISDLSDYTIDIATNIPSQVFSNSKASGTKIILNNIKDISLDEIFNGVQALICEDSPYKSKLNINFKYPKSFKGKKDLLSPNEAIPFAPFKCNISFNRNIIQDYELNVEFQGDKIFTKTLTEEFKNDFSANVPDIDLGNIEFTLNLFYFGKNFIEAYDIDKNKIQKNFLDYYYGISVYREDFKIYGLGKIDWLELTERRLNSPSKCISNKLVYGFIKLTSPASDKLEEKTSREGFIRSIYLDYLKTAIIKIIKEFEEDISSYRAKLNKKNTVNIFNVASIPDTNSGTDTNSDTDTNSGTDTNSCTDTNSG